ncbi:MAG: hypothetical protein A3G41_08945 [Elusimicrobia bacterium RIFCSPLOWO2_12_FULL_59_9]|nr:MAG: hypothetical protein A3G41_08945 [Elusimicrobia bacterium RIFCSPLOWO2_12_FULL_59_9]
MRPIKAFFFDIGNVLLKFSLHKLALELIRNTSVSLIAVKKFFLDSGLEDRYERGLLSSQEFFDEVKKQLKFRGDLEAFSKIWGSHFSENKEVVELMLDLKKRSKIYLLSNTNDLHYRFLIRNYDFLSRVDGAALSFEVGHRKPEREMYRSALNLAGVKAAESVFVDDLPENVEGARKLGIYAIRFTGLEPLKAELDNLNDGLTSTGARGYT